MHPSTTLARAVVDGLLAAGVRHVVLAPGSRSAPLAYELLAADRAGVLTLHVRVDERAAGFLALGLGKVSRVPAAVVTTSGTAVANLHPAVLEAHHGLVPLIILSADRPSELRGIGANQTTEQPGMYGTVVRLGVELSADDDDADTWRAAVQGAVRVGAGLVGGGTVPPAPGPVHVNVAFRDPLVPDLADPPRSVWPAPLAPVAEGTPATTAPQPQPQQQPLSLPERTLVVIGDLPEPDQARRVAEWAQTHGWPVVAEPFGEQPLGATVLPHGPLLLATSWFQNNQPDRIVVAGRVTLSRSVRAALTADKERVTYLAAGPRWIGPSYPVEQAVPLDVIDGDAPPANAPSTWLQSWWHAAAATSAAVESELSWGTGPGLAQAFADALPDGATLVVGSSNSVRDLEIAVDWSGVSARDSTADRSVRVVANRGLAGIDGVVSTAVGVGLASGAPTHALVGDLTFLHDANALLIGPEEPRPDLTIVVANDDGGGIFSTLEPGEPDRAADFERIFGTATGARIADLSRAYGIRYARADSADQLTDLLSRPPAGLSVIEVPIDRSGHRALRERLRVSVETRTGIDQSAEF
ncbi:MAG: 2-succinyl-5-enolpyruvyl-6-hydroxy-3-cyclohexene-1-carboxylic-acid synthase [Actinomycetia bacterium]|nr:2-succinyl-5-enolpyruvyl-6-hydroxy-3-cyclohexene-1-carboxylic-acid synthase [Actinomycetes bacterium]